MWEPKWFTEVYLLPQISRNEFFLAQHEGEIQGVVRILKDDPEYWPEAKKNEAVYFHKLAIKPKASKQGLANQMIGWIIDYAKSQECSYVRIDVFADRANLNDYYKGFGFKFHSQFNYSILCDRAGNRYQLSI